MKKTIFLLTILFVMLFAVVSCKNKPEDPGPIPTPTPYNNIVYSNYKDSFYNIYTMNDSGGNTTTILSDGNNNCYVSWTSDGTHILFGSDKTGAYQIYSMDQLGQNITRLTTDAYEDIYPAMSPDGEKITFSSLRGGVRNIYKMNKDGTGEEQLTFSDRAFKQAWSPDGTKIAFEMSGDIYIMNADGSNITRLTTSTRTDAEPVWFPDGSKILFSSDRVGVQYRDYRLYTMLPDGSDQTLLYDGVDSEFPVEINRDATKVFVLYYGRRNLYSVNMDGTNKDYLLVNQSLIQSADRK